MSTTSPTEPPATPPPCKPCRMFRADDDVSPCVVCGQPFGEHPRKYSTQADAVAAARHDEETTRLFRPWRVLPTIDDALASMPPPGERFATGLPTLDRVSRGGFARRRVYTFLAAPGKGKTALLVQLCIKAAREGAIVFGFFVDEGAWQAAVMACEGLGFDRKNLEDDYAGIQSQVCSKTRDLDLYLPDPEKRDTALDSVSEWLITREPERLVIIAGDAVQSLRVSAETDMPPTRKERADAVMTASRRIAERHDAIMLLAAKANRASWSHKNPSENLDSLSAGMDSSSIEYDSDALFFLSGDPATGSFLHVRKNRPGDGTLPTIALGYDRDRATFAEIDQDAAAAEAEAAEMEKSAAKWTADEKRVLQGVARYPDRTGNALQRLLRMQKAQLGAVLEELERKESLTSRRNGRARYWNVSNGSRDEER